jgi:TatD DNase family protein
MRLVDTHCHLYDPPLGADPAGVVARARAAGVEALVVVGTTLRTSREAVALAAVYPEVFAAVGLHPDADEPLDLNGLAGLLAAPKVVAVGEIGLDGSRGRERLDAQEPVFRAQLALARDHGLPALVHNRDATGRVLRVLQALGPGGPGGILHAYAGSREVAAQLHDLGFCLGVAGVVCRPQARRVRAVLADLPLEQLVLETDAPFIGTATRGRGQVEPAQLPEVCQALADLRGLDPAAVAAATTATARRVLERLALARHP